MDLEQLRQMARTLGDVLPLEILAEDDRLEIASHMHLRKFRADETIYHRGDPGHDAFCVFSGLVKLMLLDEEGREVIVALRKRGEFFGELALFEERPRDTTAVALDSLEAFQLARSSLWEVLERNPQVRDYAFKDLADRIHEISGRYEDQVFLDVPGRLAKYILELRRVGHDVPITQDELAAAIGSTRVTVNKLLADFERRGLVRVDRRRLHVADEQRLQAEIHR
jgi:CRP/FNR family transcriptional regulator, cyclic AMP receptor protein